MGFYILLCLDPEISSPSHPLSAFHACNSPAGAGHWTTLSQLSQSTEVSCAFGLERIVTPFWHRQ